MSEENKVTECDFDQQFVVVDSPKGTDREDFRCQDIRHVTVERIAGWIVTFIVFAAIGIGCCIALFATWPPGLWTLLVAILVVAVILSMAWSTHVYPWLAYKSCKYKFDSRGLEIHRGWIWKSIINVPLSRVQHTDVRQGPIQRQYEIGTLVVYTAGTQHASVELSGLSKTEAMRLRDQLVSKGDGQDAV